MALNGNARPDASPAAGRSEMYALVINGADPRMKLELCEVMNGIMVARVNAVASNVDALIRMLEAAANQLRAQSGGIVRAGN